MQLRGRTQTKPGSLLKDSIPIRTWTQWDDAVPGYVEIELIGHEGGNAFGDHANTLTVTDISTGWTENRSLPNKARKWVVAILAEVAAIMPFPYRRRGQAQGAGAGPGALAGQGDPARGRDAIEHVADEWLVLDAVGVGHHEALRLGPSGVPRAAARSSPPRENRSRAAGAEHLLDRRRRHLSAPRRPGRRSPRVPSPRAPGSDARRRRPRNGPARTAPAAYREPGSAPSVSVSRGGSGTGTM